MVKKGIRPDKELCVSQITQCRKVSTRTSRTHWQVLRIGTYYAEPSESIVAKQA